MWRKAGAVLAAAAMAAVCAPAPAAAADLEAMRSQIDGRRAAFGLEPASGSDPVAFELAELVARTPARDSRALRRTRGRVRRELRLGCGCLTAALNPEVAYVERTGLAGRIAFQRWSSEWSLRRNLIFFQRSLGLILDPRLEAFELAEHGDSIVLATRVDPGDDWEAPLLPLGGVINPIASNPPLALVPPAVESVTLDVLRGGEWIPDFTVGVEEGQARGAVLPLAGGAAVVRMAVSHRRNPIRLAFGREYRVRAGDVEVGFTTTPLPAAERRRGPRYADDLERRDRRAIRRSIGRGPMSLRRLIRDLDSGIRFGRRSEGSFADMTRRGVRISFSREHLRRGPNRFTELVWHELGHAIDFLALDSRGRARLDALFRSSPRFQDCFPDRRVGRGCLAPREVLADQIALAATGRSRTFGYGVPRLADAGELLTLLASEALARPAALRYRD